MNSGGSDMTIKDIIDAQATIIQGLPDKCKSVRFLYHKLRNKTNI